MIFDFTVKSSMNFASNIYRGGITLKGTKKPTPNVRETGSNILKSKNKF